MGGLKIIVMQKITLYEFNLLPPQEQHEIVHSKATFLEVLDWGSKKYVLYGLEQFYIELEYDVPSNKIISLRTFKRGKLLDKFLDKFQL